MTLPQSALSEQLDAIRAGDGIDLAREAFRLAAQDESSGCAAQPATALSAWTLSRRTSRRGAIGSPG